MDSEPPLNPQRRLRHLIGLVGRNLTPLVHQGKPRPFHSYFTLSTAPDKPPFYTSETVYNSVNPTWREFDVSQMKDTLDLGSSKFVVRLWGAYFDIDTTVAKHSAPKAEFALLVQWDLDLYGLDFFRAKLDDSDAPPTALPADTILVRLTSGYYTAALSPMAVDAPVRPEYRRFDRARVRPSYNRASLVRILTLQRAIQQVRTNTEVITEATEKSIHARRDERDVCAAVEKMRMVVATFQEEDRQRQKELTETRTRHKQRSAANEAKQAAVRRSHATLTASRDELMEMKDKLRERRLLLWQAQQMVTVRQTRIILELSQIFPLQQGPPPAHAWSICRLELPSSGDYLGLDEDAVATALGYVSHLTFMIAKYLEVPFRFPMRPMCSRSTVVDEVSSVPSEDDRTFPLYAHGRNKLRFEYAVFMLNVNIGQLLAHCGIRPVPGASTLGNLHVLFRHFLSLNHAHNGQVFPPQVQQPPQPAAPPAQHQAQTMQAPMQASVQAPMQAQAPMHMGTVPT